MRYVLAFLALVVLIAGGLWMYAGTLAGPSIEIAKPVKYVGLAAPLDVTVTAPGARLKTLRIVFEQNGHATPLFSLESPSGAAGRHVSGARVRITGQTGPEPIPDMRSA